MSGVMIFALFWTSMFLVLYSYLGLPILVLMRGALWSRPPLRADIEPTVSIIIAAHNEAGAIIDRLNNLQALDYPCDRLEIIIASDGSEDDTNELVRRYRTESKSELRLLALARGGKAAALDTASMVATGEVMVFTDANTVFPANTLRALVRPFADPRVGGVAGDQRYTIPRDRPGADAGERWYWNLDRMLKRAQSRAGSVTSATGAIYAIRRELYEAIPAGVTDDYFVSTAVIARGRRLVFEPDAVAYEEVASSAGFEFTRKVRIISQGLRSIAARTELLDPRRTGFYALQMFSHKILRRLTVAPLVVLAYTSAVLWPAGSIYRAATLAQIMLYTTACLGGVWSRTSKRMPRSLALPLYFCLVNVACLVAIANIARGRRIDRWEPKRFTAGGPDGL